ncbi:MAG: hypothetical protein RIB58_05995 [Phycisphaerales bacterium]
MPRADATTPTTPTTPTTIAAALALAGAALAQPAITIEVDNPVLRPGESTVVTMWAGFDPSDYAMAGLETSLVTSVGSEGWSEAQLVAPMDGSGTWVGEPSATGYDQIIARQLHGLAGIYGDDSNPIAFWRATYTAPVDVPSAFSIDLTTASADYDVYIDRESALSESRLAELVEGSATIRVIPAPASALVLALGAVAARRRR